VPVIARYDALTTSEPTHAPFGSVRLSSFNFSGVSQLITICGHFYYLFIIG